MSAEMKVAYLCSEYPAVSHTFVLREVTALRRLGMTIETFSIRRSRAEHLLAEADCAAFASTYAILPPQWLRLILAHLYLAATAPRAYLDVLSLAMRLSRPGWRARLWQLFYFVEAVVLWNRCRALGIRHVHVHFANAAADIALLASRLGTRLEPASPWSWSFTMHGPTEFANVSAYGMNAKVEQAEFVICISDYARSQLMGLTRRGLWQKLHVVHVGIPLAQFERTSSTHRSSDVHILFVGRHVPEKGHAVLLEGVAMLARRNHRLRVTLVGDGPERIELEHLADRLGLASHVAFTGAVGQDDIMRIYESATIFCLPSFAEGVPTVLMEAMAMQLPVVSTWIAGIPELVEHERSGFLVAPGRPDALADQLERLIADPDLAERLGEAGREKVTSRFDVVETSLQLHRVFSSYLSRRRDADSAVEPRLGALAG
jgi:colanic acid/amylovoran biosynthesis glycosyltransferase